MMADLKGKAGIVTGGSSGIGFQIANVLAEAGATVYVVTVPTASLSFIP